MAPEVEEALTFDSVSFGLLRSGREHVQGLEHDVVGRRHANPLVEERQVGMVFGVSGRSDDGSSQCMYSRTECCKGPGGRSIEALKTLVINELSQYCGRIDPSPMDLMS